MEVALGDVGPVAAPRVDAHGPRRVHERRVRLGARVVVERVRVVDERAELRHLAPVQDLRAGAEPLRRLQDLQRRREAPRLDAARAEDVRGDRELAPARNPNLPPDFNVRVIERFDASSSALLRELDERNRSVQKSAESTSM